MKTATRKSSSLGGRDLIAIVLLLGAVVVAGIVGVAMMESMSGAATPTRDLFVMVVAGLVALLLVVTIIATTFSFLDLTDKTQAMGLPEGSIRAVLALALLLLFAIMTVFLYGTLQSPPSGALKDLRKEEALAFVKAHPAYLDFKMDPQPVAPGAAPAPPLYSVTYGGTASDGDFAKQILTLLGTLLTSVVSFYFGAKTATTSASASAAQTLKAAGGAPAMTLSGVQPTSAPGPTVDLAILGANLNGVVHARLERAGAPGPVQLTGVQSSATRVSGRIAVTDAMTGPPAWDVVVDDGDGGAARLGGVLTLTKAPAAPPANPASPAFAGAAGPATAGAADSDEGLDGCDGAAHLDDENLTADADLPPTTGGVAG